LRWAAGDELAVQVRQFAPLRPGRVMVTLADALPACFLLHAATGTGVGPGLRASRDLLGEIVASCFYYHILRRRFAERA
jgi:hypothetical protein